MGLKTHVLSQLILQIHAMINLFKTMNQYHKILEIVHSVFYKLFYGFRRE